MRENLLAGYFLYALSLFDMEVANKSTPQSALDPAGRVFTFTTNAGSQYNRGIEAALKYAIIRNNDSPLSLVQPFVSYTFSNFRYNDFKSATNTGATLDFSHNKVVGVPINVFDAGLDVALKWGVYLYATYQWVDKVPRTFDNTHFAKSYSLLNAKLGYRTDLPEHFHVDVFVGANNLLGNLYYTFVFLNMEPTVYLNGPYSPVVYGGVNLSYSL